MTNRLKTNAGLSISAALLALGMGAGPAHAEMYVAKNLKPDSAPNLCLDFGGALRLAECVGSQTQRLTTRSYDFRLPGASHLPTGVRATKIEINGGAQCLESGQEGQAVFFAPCRNVNAQAWRFGGSSGEIRNLGTQLCVDVAGSGGWRVGTPVIAYRCHGGVNQRWSLRDASGPQPQMSGATLRPEHASQKCLDATRDGNLILYTCHGGQNQRFSFRYGGTTAIRVQSGGCLTAAPGGVVRVAACSDGPEQRWTVFQNGEFRHASGRCLDVSASGRDDGAQLLHFQCHGGQNQRFMAAR